MGPTCCRGCGADLAPGSRFCSSCGVAVALTTETEERRTVTVLFADLSGYTAMSERLDPETVKTVVGEALGRLADEVARHGGHVDKFIGDNVMALFGAPVAHEDDPLRAVRTGLAMQDAMAEINRRVGARAGDELRLCVGVNTGEVLAGAMGGGYTVVGDAVNVAARLQSAAEPGSVLVGPATHRATLDEIEYVDVGAITLKGKAEAVGAWRAAALRRPGRDARVGKAPLMGRAAELGRLEELYRGCLASGRSVVATVVGEPGVGKTRLARELVGRLTGGTSAAQVLWGASVPYGSGSAYWAVGEVLGEQFGIEDGDGPDAAADKLRAGLRDLIAAADQRERAFASLAPLVGAAAAGTLGGDPAAARGETFAAVRQVLTLLAERQPVIVVLEDIHWADSAVLDLVDYLGDSLDASVMIVCLARPELLERSAPATSAEAGRLVVRLEPLGHADVVGLIRATAGPTLDESADAIVARCGGIPLFVEEMVRHLSDLDGDPTGVPETLQGLLVARLDLLEPQERRLLQRASVLGATFARADLASALADVHERDEVDEIVQRLCQRQFLRHHAEELSFHHVLMRDAAYSLLPKVERARLHMDVADRMAEAIGDLDDTAVAVVAEHYLQAALLADDAYLPDRDRERARSGALRHLLAAGDRAGNLNSDEAALAQYEAALTLTPSADLLVDLSERIGDAAMRLGEPTRAIEAWQRAQLMLPAADKQRLAELDRRVGRAYLQVGERERAIERFQHGINRLIHDGPDAGLIRLYEEAALLYSEAGENMLAIYTGEQALAAAEQLGMISAASRARGVFGVVLGRLGDAAGAQRSFEAALAPDTLDDTTRAALLRAFARHLRVHEGDTVAARSRLDEALALADRLGDVPLQVDLAGELAEIALHAGDWSRVEALTSECERLRHEGGFTGRRALPFRLRAWLAAERGDLSESRRLFRLSWENAVSTGTAEEAVAALRGLAVIELRSGRHADAVTHLREAQRLCDAGDMLSASADIGALLVEGLAAAGDLTSAADALEEVRGRAARSGLPAAKAALLEAEGVVGADRELLDQARQHWLAVGRPVDAARCAELSVRLP